MSEPALPTPGISDELIARASSLPGEGRRAILGIAGAPGAGKTLLAEQLVQRLCQERGAGWAAHLPMDGFHMGDQLLTALGRLDRKGAPDTFDVDGYASVLARVRAAAGDVYVPGFDRRLEQPIAADMSVPVTAKLVVTEGNYLLLEHPSWRSVRSLLDDVWYVSVADELRVSRLIDRHIMFGKTEAQARDWVQNVDQPNARRIDAVAAGADRVVSNEGTMFR